MKAATARIFGLLAGFIIVLILVSSTFVQSGPSVQALARFSQHRRTQALLDSVTNETLGFQKIFVINLPSASHNRDAMSLAASLTGIQVEYIDGVTGFDPKNLPAHPEGGPYQSGGKPLSINSLGSWRAHMNAIRAIVEQNLASALIIEDDGDWDVRIKSQLQDFAHMSRMLVQPLVAAPSRFLDPTNPRQSPDDQFTDIEATDPRPVQDPVSSPYGDIERWDTLWLGHCGSNFAAAETPDAPLGRIVMRNDPTVPQTHLQKTGYGDHELQHTYPNGTRIVSWNRGAVCNLAYGVSLHGARKFVYEMGVANMSSSTDTMLRHLCDGIDGRPQHKCVGVRPPLFDQRKGIPPVTYNIRWSTKMNLGRLVKGETDMVDAWPDAPAAEA